MDVYFNYYKFVMGNAWTARGVQPDARGLHAAQDGSECSPHKIINSLKTV